jgi:hypothetical protein
MTIASAGCREDSNRKIRIERRETAGPTNLLFVILLKQPARFRFACLPPPVVVHYGLGAVFIIIAIRIKSDRL